MVLRESVKPITVCLIECASVCLGGRKSIFFGFSKGLRAQTVCLNPGSPNFCVIVMKID